MTLAGFTDTGELAHILSWKRVQTKHKSSNRKTVEASHHHVHATHLLMYITRKCVQGSWSEFERERVFGDEFRG